MFRSFSNLPLHTLRERLDDNVELETIGDEVFLLLPLKKGFISKTRHSPRRVQVETTRTSSLLVAPKRRPSSHHVCARGWIMGLDGMLLLHEDVTGCVCESPPCACHASRTRSSQFTLACETQRRWQQQQQQHNHQYQQQIHHQRHEQQLLQQQHHGAPNDFQTSSQSPLCAPYTHSLNKQVDSMLDEPAGSSTFGVSPATSYLSMPAPHVPGTVFESSWSLRLVAFLVSDEPHLAIYYRKKQHHQCIRCTLCRWTIHTHIHTHTHTAQNKLTKVRKVAT